MQLNFSSILFFLFIINSCSPSINNEVISTLIEKKNIVVEKIQEPKKKIQELNKKQQDKSEKKTITTKKNFPIYLIGEPYFIEGIKYTPKENYTYNQTGLASFYGKELHNKKTVNNELNKVTELYARHKTLPLPSVVKITNLENGLSVMARVNDRSNDNSTIIEVSRKVAQLLRFYKPKLAKVRVEILSDPSKQLKIVTQSMNSPEFNLTIESAPTESVIVTDLGETLEEDLDISDDYDPPIELGMETVVDNKLFVKISEVESYEEITSILKQLDGNYKTTTQKEGNNYILLFGPMTNQKANNLFHILVGKGYKNLEIVIE